MPDVAWTGEWQPPAEQFGTQNTGMYFGSGSALRLVRSVFGDDWVSPDTVYIGPPPEGGEMYMSYHGFGVVETDSMSDTTLNASFDFASVATNQKWQESFLRSTTVLVPHQGAVEAVRNDQEFADNNPLLMDLYDQFSALEEDFDRPPTIPESPTIASILDTEFSAAALGEKSAQQAVDDAESQVNNELSS
jgi:ABC-type glycerol-3-phosphate transport system substrate-binding protein